MEAEAVVGVDTYVVAAALDADVGTALFAIWFDGENRNRIVTSNGRIAWAGTEIAILKWAELRLGAASSVLDDPPAICDVPALLHACSSPDEVESEFALLTTIDLLDDLREAADDLLSDGTDRARTLELRRVHDDVRDGLMDGQSWRRSLQLAGGSDKVSEVALWMLKRVTAASTPVA